MAKNTKQWGNPERCTVPMMVREPDGQLRPKTMADILTLLEPDMGAFFVRHG